LNYQASNGLCGVHTAESEARHRRGGVFGRVLLQALLIAAVGALAMSATASAEEKVSITASFVPDILGSPTLAEGSAIFENTSGLVPSPLSKVTIVGPAGLGVNLKGTAICSPAVLEERGPEGCPARSVAGSGGGVGVFEIAHEVISENFTLNLFVGNNKPGHLEVLLYVNAVSPVSVQLVFRAPVIKEPKPYGMGFSFEVPPIATLPEASNASVKTAHITIGATPAEQRQFHVVGLTVPKSCPAGGFPVETVYAFEDGSDVTSKSAIKCPKGSKSKKKKH
jgi:hypothetical protein